MHVPAAAVVLAMTAVSTARRPFNPIINNLPSCKSVQSKAVVAQPQRAQAIVEAYLHAWSGYHEYAFPQDELKPLSKSGVDSRYGWGLTIVDGLDTAIIMRLQDVLEASTKHISSVDFSSPFSHSKRLEESHKPVSAFETNIRYLGGLLSAYDLLSSEPFKQESPDAMRVMLLEKAQVLANKLVYAFDTPSGIAAPYVDFKDHVPIAGQYQDVMSNFTHNSTSTAGLGTYLLEFYRLSDISGNDTYRLLAERSEDRAVFPYPPPKYRDLVGSHFDTDTGNMLNFAGGWQSSLDSFLEYLIKSYQYTKTHMTDFYKEKWLRAVESTETHLSSHPYGFPNLTFLDTLDANGSASGFQDNYACFAGGNILLGCKLLELPELCDFGLSITDSCHWIYNHTETGLGPVVWYWFNETNQQPTHSYAESDPARRGSAEERGFYIRPGSENSHSYVPYSMYMSFPETIESIFYAYRITGDPIYQDWAWEVFKVINTTCRNEIAFAGILNVDTRNGGVQLDKLDSFFFAETLKYLYLIFDAPEVVSLDRWVFNTEAHPFLIQCDENFDSLQTTDSQWRKQTLASP